MHVAVLLLADLEAAAGREQRTMTPLVRVRVGVRVRARVRVRVRVSNQAPRVAAVEG